MSASEPCRYWLNSAEGRDAAAVRALRLESDAAYAYHRGLPGYAPTPLVPLGGRARDLGLGGVWVKDESRRFGLNAFKVLGASYAVHRVLMDRTGPVTFCTATDGNHGRAVAWSARQSGQQAVVFVPQGTVAARIQAIESEGARVVVVQGDYDAAVRTAAETARANDWTLVQDTAWDGYTTIPAWIMAGYTTILRELEAAGHMPAASFDLVVLQAGVGSWAAAAAWHLRRQSAEPHAPRILCVEPTAAACCLESAEAGRRVTARGAGRTIMAGLNCATPSSLAWPILSATVDAFLAIPDDYARRAMRALHHPHPGDARIEAGESGAAGLGALLALCAERTLAPVRAHLDLGCTSRILVVNTEGATDLESFRAICETRLRGAENRK
jgi:diaminopropionate ammonia-lyase